MSENLEMPTREELYQCVVNGCTGEILRKLQQLVKIGAMKKIDAMCHEESLKATIVDVKKRFK